MKNLTRYLLPLYMTFLMAVCFSFGGCLNPAANGGTQHGGQPSGGQPQGGGTPPNQPASPAELEPPPPSLPAEPPSGEFAYIITYPQGAAGDIALYLLPDMVDMGLSPSHVCEANGLTEWVELAAGSYLLTVQVTLGGQSVEIAETVAIFPALLTEYDKEFFDSDFASPPTGGQPPVGEQEQEPPPIEPAPTRTVTVDMFTLAGNGWEGNAALKIVVNGEVITDGATVPAAYSSSYTFTVAEADTVQFFWVAGLSQGEYSFIAYYADTPPIPAFSADQKGSVLWFGANALLFRTRGFAPAGLYKVTDGTLLGEFTVVMP